MISIAFYNLKGGVGKTTTAVNMAYLAAEAKKIPFYGTGTLKEPPAGI